MTLAQLEYMSFSGNGALATCASSNLIAGRRVTSSVSILIAVQDGSPSINDPSTKPFIAVSVKQVDAGTGAVIFEGLRYSNSLDFKLEEGMGSATLMAQVKVNSLAGSDSRTANLDLKWLALKPIERVSQSNSKAERGDVANEKHSAKLRLSKCTGTVTIQGLGGDSLSLDPVGQPMALWHSISSGTRTLRPKRGEPGSNEFSGELSLDHKDTEEVMLWATTSMTAQTTGSWTGYWTWNATTKTWYWTWVWVPATANWSAP